MDWLLGLLLALFVLLIGLLLALLYLRRQEGSVPSPEDSSAGAPAPPPAARSIPSPQQRLSAAANALRERLAGVTASLPRRRHPPAQPEPGADEEADAGPGQAPSYQERVGRRLRDGMAGAAGPQPRAEAADHRRIQPIFTRKVLIVIVVVMIVALAISFWRVGRSIVAPGPAPQLTILLATLPGSAEGQSSAELQAHLQQEFAAAGLTSTVTLQVISEQPADAADAYALARSRQSDMLLWGHVRADLVPGYFLTLTLAPRFLASQAPEFPEYGAVMMTPAHFTLNRIGNRGLSKNDVGRTLTWITYFYTGQFERLESVPPAEVQGNVPAALFQFHWLALRWLAGDYEGAKTAYAGLGCPVEFVPPQNIPSPRLQAERQVCLAAANNRAVTLITQESLGQVPASSLDAAITTLSSIVEVAPASTTAWYNLGRACLSRGRWDEAVHALEKAVEQNPNLAAAWAALSEASTEAGSLPRAREAASTAMSRNSNLVAAYLAQGRYMLAVNQPQQADDILAQALQRAEAETTRRRSQEAALREGPAANAARANFTAAWARRNNTMLARTHLARARVFLRQGQIEGRTPFLLWLWRLIIGEIPPLEKANAQIDLALESHPDWAAALRLRAQLFIAQGTLEDAVVLLRRLQEQDPNDIGVYQDLVVVLRRQWREHRAAGRTAEAQQKLADLRAQYQLLIDRNIDPALGYFGLGDVAQENEEWDTARAAFLQAVEVDDKYAEAYLRLGQVELQTPDEAKALAYLDQALEASAKKGTVAVATYCERGEILLERHLRLKAEGRKGPVADAQQAFEAALKLNGRTVRALNGMGRIAYEDGDAAGAESRYRQAQAVEARNFDTLYGLGRVNEARGQSKAARDYMLQAVVARSTSIAAHYHLGVAYYALLDEVLARRNFEWVQQACANLDQQKRPKADDVESCAGVEDWLRRLAIQE